MSAKGANRTSASPKFQSFPAAGMWRVWAVDLFIFLK